MATQEAIRFTFGMQSDTIVYKRYVYTIWAFFGEIFGLNEIITTVLIGNLVLVLNTLTGRSLNTFLVS